MFPYKEEAGGSNPSTPTEKPCYCWAFFVLGTLTARRRIGRDFARRSP